MKSRGDGFFAFKRERSLDRKAKSEYNKTERTERGTVMFLQKTRVLSGNALKILAAACMLCDHVAYMLLPATSPLYLPLRALGRLAFPLFAYMLAEGCRYTRDKFCHFALLFCVAVGCQIVYYLFDNGNLEMSVLVTFTLSEGLIFALQKFKKDLFSSQANPLDKILSGTTFAAGVVCVFLLCSRFSVDYGFFGCLLPVLVSLPDFRGVTTEGKTENVLRAIDCALSRLVCTAIGITLLAVSSPLGALQYFSFLALVPLLLYGGRKGKLRLKYFFYVFYPLHLVILQGIQYLIYTL